MRFTDKNVVVKPRRIISVGISRVKKRPHRRKRLGRRFSGIRGHF